MSPKIAIIGTGPSGLYLSLLLATRGLQVSVFDPKTPWEKPCGGTLAMSAFERLPGLESFSQFSEIDALKVVTPKGKVHLLSWDAPMKIALRREVSEYLRHKAERAGVIFADEKIETLSRPNSHWKIGFRGGEEDADFVVGADGATNFIRRSLNLNGAAEEKTIEVSYELPIPYESGRVSVVKFLKEINGSFWATPRPDGMTARLWSTSKQIHARSLFDMLDNILTRILEIPIQGAVEKSVAHIPIYRRPKLRDILGDGWALIGEAAGFVNPLSQDSLYYSLKSAATLALSFREKFLDGSFYREHLEGEVFKPIQKRIRQQRMWERSWVLEYLIRRAVANKTDRNAFLELVAGLPTKASQKS